uniref:Uncharacterized protein n=1 Tax=Peronospora matthiolae TaxID=2874970 RepID=A0AAV1V8A5_9STRA
MPRKGSSPQEIPGFGLSTKFEVSGIASVSTLHDPAQVADTFAERKRHTQD